MRSELLTFKYCNIILILIYMYSDVDVLFYQSRNRCRQAIFSQVNHPDNEHMFVATLAIIFGAVLY